MQAKASIPRTFITANDLHLWANRWEAPSLLPRLLRRLIHDTVERIERMNFPADESVRLKGWDGYLNVERGNAFVPNGRSVWELGTGHDAKRKADEDYEKRTVNPGEIVPGETTFVFVTPRIWPGKKEWASARQAENVWRGVRAYDAEDLATWLEQAPRQHLWLSSLLGKHPEGVTEIAVFWEEWSEATVPAFTPELVLAGRQDEADRLNEWLRNPASVLTIQAESRKEAIAFFAAAMHCLPTDDQEIQFARGIVVKDESAWPQLVACGDSLVLIPTFEDREGAAAAAKSNHHVLIPIGRDEKPSSETLIVPRVRSGNAREALLAAGLSEAEAEPLAALAQRSLLAFRRKLATSSALQQPAWAAPAEARALLPVILVGAWNDAISGDREVISRLARRPYEELNEVLVRWASESDPPVRRVGDTWLLVSREDSWELLAPYLTRTDLESFEEGVLSILGEPDPSFELPSDRRWMAGVLGRPSPNSGLLREGIAETLAIMGARAEVTRFSGSSSGQEWVNRIVRQLLGRANADWRIWASVAGLLPLLAEAAPDVFVESVDQGISGDEPVLLNLFTENRDSFFGGSYHTGLLWALETLAWSPTYLARAALILAKLARLDPGGKLLNRPHNSLRDIFLFWHPNTAAGIEQRLRILDAIRSREPQIAWRLLYSLLPDSHSWVSPTSTPRWREWTVDKRPQVTYAELWEAARETVKRLLEDVGTDGKRWQNLIAAVDDLPPEQQDAIIERLLGTEVDSFTVEARIEITDALRTLISRHREFPDADWAMPVTLVDRLQSVHDRFEPEDPVLHYVWLFSKTPKPMEPRSRDWRERFETLETARLEAVRDLYARGGLPLLLRMASSAERPEEVGFNLGRSELLAEEEDDLLTKHLGIAGTNHEIFASAFIGGRVRTRGDNWVNSKLAQSSNSWSHEQRAAFFGSLPFEGRTWDLLESAEEEVRHLYWSMAAPHGMPPVEDCERAVRELVKHGRSYIAVDLLPYYVDKDKTVVPATVIVEALQGLLREGTGLDRPNIGHDISQLLDAVEESGEIEESQIAALEWAYLPLLERYYRGPKVLHRELSRSPELFAEVIRMVYKAEDEESQETTDEDGVRARLGYRLLQSWRHCPGSTGDGAVDIELLRTWIFDARRLLQEAKRTGVGDLTIGKVLSYAPSDPDSAWPHAAVRDLIEDLSSEDIERGVELGVYNNRGVVTRSLTEGGAQERRLAETYERYSGLTGDRWPRTAAMLRRLAATYYAEARREDVNAELTDEMATRERALTLRVPAERPAKAVKSGSPAVGAETQEEFEAALDSLADGSDDRPVLPPEAFMRENIYQDHD